MVIKLKKDFLKIFFGSSDPWHVTIDPHDGAHDERLKDIIIEKNRFLSGYGIQSGFYHEGGINRVQVSLNIRVSNTTLRNNVFDGNGIERSDNAISIGQRGVEPAPSGNRIFNNTIYKVDTVQGYAAYTDINVDSAASQTIAQNNLIILPSSGTEIEMIHDESTDMINNHNLMPDNPDLVDPENTDYPQKSLSPRCRIRGKRYRNLGSVI